MTAIRPQTALPSITNVADKIVTSGNDAFRRRSSSPYRRGSGVQTYSKQEADSRTSPTLMERSDSGFAEVSSSRDSSSHSSPSSHDRRSSSGRRKSSGRPSTSSKRPAIKRSSKSASAVYQTTNSSSLRQRQASNFHSYNSSLSSNFPTQHPQSFDPSHQFQPHQYIRFPSISDSSHETATNSTPPPLQPPPATIHYWTSEETRRLEYAAIDAASRGLRGFFFRMMPDCMVPRSFRGTKFHNDDDTNSDAGSVRRYRLSFSDQDEKCLAAKQNIDTRPGALRRWTTSGRRL